MEFLRYGLQGLTILEQNPYSEHIMPRQDSTTVLFASCPPHTALQTTILEVVLVCPKKQVFRVDTLLIVAFMANTETLRYLHLVVRLEDHTVPHPGLTFVPLERIPVVCGAMLPNNALTGVYCSAKLVFKVLSHDSVFLHSR